MRRTPAVRVAVVSVVFVPVVIVLAVMVFLSSVVVCVLSVRSARFVRSCGRSAAYAIRSAFCAHGEGLQPTPQTADGARVAM